MLDNIFHCCVQKTGSQWIKAIFADEKILKQTKLQIHSYQSAMPGGFDPRILSERAFDTPFPSKTIISPLYINYGNYKNIPKPKNHRAFFIMRDPRDIVVSWYYSVKHSHAPMGQIAEFRKKFEQSDLYEGMKFSVEYLDEFGIFEAILSWHQSEADPNVLLVKYEDLISDNSKETFAKIFVHCQIKLKDKKLEAFIDKYSFKSMSKREPGQEDKESHLRKGISGDWENSFSEDLKNCFKQKTGNLLVMTGYESDQNW